MFKINRLTYKYDKERKALDNVSMDFDKGDVIGIIGSNGSGKSTLFNNLMGILKATDGEILYKNNPLKYDKKSLYNLRKEVGIVFQDPEKQIFYSMVYDDLAFALRNIGMDEKSIKDRINKALDDVNGREFINRPVHSLSFGQKKRVAIASVIAMENDLILLDEPTAGLDPESTRAIVDIIKSMYEKGKKIVITSHDMNLIYDICDYIYVLNKGKVISDGNVLEVFANKNKIEEAGLELPWLVKLNKNMNLPLFRKEEDLYNYWRENFREYSCL